MNGTGSLPSRKPFTWFFFRSFESAQIPSVSRFPRIRLIWADYSSSRVECKAYFVRLRGLRRIREMSKQTPKQEPKEDTAGAASFRPVGLSISSFFYALSGVYYLAFPIVSQDPLSLHLYAIGGASLLGSLGVFMMTRWGLWLGLLLFPLQVVAPASTLLTVLSYPGVWQQPIAIAFVASLFVLMFFASLAFLLVLDKRRSFN